MIAESVTESKPPSDEPDFSKFADRDFTERVEIDEDQDWIKDELARRLQLIDSGQAKFITLEELRARLEKLPHETAHHP